MDGVLIDAKDWHYEALNSALSLFGAEINRQDHLSTFDGLPTKKKLELLSLKNGLPLGLHSFIGALKQQFTFEAIFAKCNPVFQHQFALSQLKKDGYKLAVASNSISQTVNIMMEKAGLVNYLDFCLSSDDVTKSKPDPEIYLMAIKKLNLAPAECLIVEDNEHGIKAALDSGAHLLKVKDTTDVTYHRIIKRIQELEND